MPEANKQLDIVYRMMSAFASSSDIGQTLYEGLDYIREEIGAEAASFFMLQDSGDVLRCDACIGPPILPAWKCQPIKALSAP